MNKQPKKSSNRSLFFRNQLDRFSYNLTGLFSFFLSLQEALKHFILLRLDSIVVNIRVHLSCPFV